MNPAIVLLALGGGALILGRKKRTRASTVDAEIGVSDEFEVMLPRQAASFSAKALGASKGIVEVIERSDSPAGTYYVIGRNPGIVEVSFYERPDRTGLFARYVISITG